MTVSRFAKPSVAAWLAILAGDCTSRGSLLQWPFAAVLRAVGRLWPVAHPVNLKKQGYRDG
jgi:hypothetical protein